jgi:putative spermidine/putrescine transport system permease protein
LGDTVGQAAAAGMIRAGTFAARTYEAALYLFMALPALVVVGASLNTSDLLSFPPTGLTLRWYAVSFQNAAFMQSLWVSIWLAVVATILALLIGGPAAYALARYEFRGRDAALSILLSPLAVPAVVFAIGLLQLLVVLGLARTFTGLVIGHFVIALPYVVRTLTAAFTLFDPALEQAARNLRASTFQMIRRVTLPVMLPSILSAAVFAFVTSFGNLTVSIFLAGPRLTTLPVQIFAYVDQSLDPSVAAVSTIVIMVTLVIILMIERLVGLQRIV